jgi:hypothetical protein
MPALGPILTATLKKYGLEGLTSWASNALTLGLSEPEILLQLEEQPAYKTAFPEIEARQKRARDLGISLPPISPDFIIDYRASARQLMRSWGVPVGFWDSNADFGKWIVEDKSLDEMNFVLELASKRVYRAAPEVRQMFDELTGGNGDQALFTFFLDHTRAPTVLEEMVEQAEIGGAARRFGFQLERDRIEELATYNISYGEATQGFASLDETRGLFEESLFEEGVDYTIGEEGVSAVFGLGGGAAEKLKQRAGARTAQTAGSAGGIREERGATSLGGAGRR